MGNSDFTVCSLSIIFLKILAVSPISGDVALTCGAIAVSPISGDVAVTCGAIAVSPISGDVAVNFGA